MLRSIMYRCCHCFEKGNAGVDKGEEKRVVYYEHSNEQSYQL